MTLIKQRGSYPSMRSLLEDFWNNDTLSEDRFWNTRVNLPAVNIIEKDDKFLIELAAPGLRKEDFKINIENGILQIDSESQRESLQRYTATKNQFRAHQRPQCTNPLTATTRAGSTPQGW